jgi:spore coat protein A
MKIGRRGLLYGSTGLAAAITTGAVWRARARGTGSLPVPSSTRGIICNGDASPQASPVSSAAIAPVRAPLHPERLARFVDPLPIPSVLAPSGSRPDPRGGRGEVPYYRVSMRAAELRVHRDLPPTPVWSYGGEVPGPTFETRSGQALMVEWANDLPARHFLPIDRTLHGAHADAPEVRAVVHVHGAKAPSESDGYPEDWLVPGSAKIALYPNEQDAATLWYHDHAMGLERLNQYAGLFGLFLVRDAIEDGLGLPDGRREVPLVLCDRLFYADGQLRYPTSSNPASPWVSEVNGDAILVNGKLTPYLDVEPRAYRFRLVNAANSRFFDLSLSNGRPFQLIGADQGLLPAPVEQTRLTLAPGERGDLVVDFGAMSGETIHLRTGVVDLLQIRVAAGGADKARPLPKVLRRIDRFKEADAVTTRTLTLGEYTDPKAPRMLMLLDDKYWRDPVSERPKLSTVEIWSLMNLTGDSHPIHLHLVRFQVLDRQLFDADEYQTSGAMHLLGPRLPPEPGERGWKDTVRAYPGAITRIAARFEGYAGKYVWHCHVLEHAANEMMRPFEVVA